MSVTLPKPIKNRQSVKRQILNFRGINLSNNYTDGDMADCYGLTTDGYPYLTQRLTRKKVQRLVSSDPETYEDYTAPTQIWEWDGKLIVIAMGKLYYDSAFICYVSDGQKQFAVVNTKLIVWPDKLIIDLTDNTYEQMDRTITSGKSYEFSEQTLTLPYLTNIRKDQRGTSFGGNYRSYIPTVYTYGTDVDALAECWTDTGWDETKLKALEQLTAVWRGDDVGLPTLDKGHIMLVNYSGATYGYESGFYNVQLPETNYENGGYYAVITLMAGSLSITDSSWGPYFDVYTMAQGITGIDDIFSVGDAINISGATNSENNVEKARITAIDSSTNTITFNVSFTEETGKGSRVLTLQIAIPSIDFICEHDNRLWGVSNEMIESDDGSYKSRVIYASSLGLPTRFWDYGTDSGAYSVAVGSEGDFTAICSYGNGVCCWKENKLHKIVGDYPSNYYMNTYVIAGVQANSYRSLIVINEVMYYKGTNGIYAYTGGAPSRISAYLGDEIYTDAATGTDGQNLYVSMKNESGTYAFWKYSLAKGFWLKESNEHILAMTTCNAKMYYIVYDNTENNVPYVANTDSDETISWMCEFKPFAEAISSSSKSASYIIRGNYPRKIFLDLDMASGATMKAEMSVNDGDWETVWEATSYTGITKLIPVVLNRTDRTALRLSGTGKTILRALVREYIKGEKI